MIIGIGIEVGKSAVLKPNGSPSDLVANVISDSEIQLVWTNGATNQDGTYIYYRVSGIGSYTLLYDLTGSGNSYTLNELTTATTYDFKVVHYKGSKLSEYSNVATENTYATQDWLTEQIDDANLLTKIDAIFSFVADTETNGKTEIINKTKVATLVNTPTFKPYKGFFSQGSTAPYNGYLNLNWNPSVDGVKYTRNSASKAIFVIDDMTAGVPITGVYDDATEVRGNIFNAKSSINGNYNVTVNGTSRGGALTGKVSGLHMITRTSNQEKLYSNNDTYTPGVDSSRALFNGNEYALTISDYLGNPKGTCDARIGLIIYGEAFSRAEFDTLREIVNNYMTLNKVMDDSNLWTDNQYVDYQKKSFRWYDQNGSKWIGADDAALYYSTDSGVNKTRYAFANAQKVNFAHIFDNGNIVFGGQNWIYKSTDSLVSASLITPKLPNGSDYTYHIPVNATYPGEYFFRITKARKVLIEGTEHVFFGNYCNLSGGAAPVNMYHLKDDCTLIVFYQFGQNPSYRDNGASTPSAVAGNLLGDSGNSNIARHIHSCAFDEVNSTIYFCTGDASTDIGWYKTVWDGEDGYTTSRLTINAVTNPRYKSIGMNCINEVIYWGVDSTGNANENGVFSSSVSTIETPSSHTQLKSYSTYEILDLIVDGQVMIATILHDDHNKILLSKNSGSTWVEIELNNVSKQNKLGLIRDKNSDGYYMMTPNPISLYQLSVYVKVK